MRFVAFIVRRIVQSILVLLGLSILIFVISRIMPGNPARMAVGPRAPQYVIDEMSRRMHLHEPLHVQYYYWLRGALHGDLGDSLVTKRAVADDIKEFFPATLELTLFAGFIMAGGGMFVGILSARHKDKWIDNVLRVVSYLGVVTPSFIFAIFFLLLFGMTLEWMPTMSRLSPGVSPPPTITGLITVDSLLSRNLTTFLDALRHLILPGLALAMGGLAQESRITRSAMSDNLTKDYIASARSLGIPERVIMRRFLLKPSLIPTISILGLDFAGTMANAFLVEFIFNWPGSSSYGYNAMLSKDLNAIAGVVLVMGVVFTVVNIVVDIVVGLLDPRIRLAPGRGE